jgi:ABC-type antimicrobial peptide transport system permease subunit
MQILRNVFKRKLRVILTISGITIGVFALVLMGSMAEKINLLVSGGTRYYSGPAGRHQECIRSGGGIRRDWYLAGDRCGNVIRYASAPSRH